MAAPRSKPLHKVVRKSLKWIGRAGLEAKLAGLLFVAAIAASILTFAAMTGHAPGLADKESILVLFVADLTLLVLLTVVIGRRVVLLFLERRRKAAGSRLHFRLVGIFTSLALLPTITIAIFSVILFDFGLQGWFSQRVGTAVRESLAVAEAYMLEHKRTISGDAMAMERDLNRAAGAVQFNPGRFNQLVRQQATLRSLAEAVVIDADGRIHAQAGFSLRFDMSDLPPTWAKTRADAGEVVILAAGSDNLVRAVLKLDAYRETYLIVGRQVDPTVLGHMRRTADAVRLYEEIEGERTGLLLTFGLIFLLVGLLLVLAAAWLALMFADRLSKPLGSLIGAAERVRQGDLDVQVKESSKEDEISALSRVFNRMTSDLKGQRAELLRVNEEIEERHRFIETVLSGVTPGVIGLDPAGRVTLPNRSACRLLGLSVDELKGRPVRQIDEAFGELFADAISRPEQVHEQQIRFQGADGRTRIFLARLTAEEADYDVLGYVLTFDDISELVAAQRKAAWADVARRIAHEIKNPLTPIQLSAERLKRRYLKQIDEDPETFVTCTDTIVRQVGDIGRMVDEFSAFARMPAPILRREDLRTVVREALSLQEAADSPITFRQSMPEEEVAVSCDPGQVRQAVTNLLKNAIEAIEARQDSDQDAGRDPAPGVIEIAIEEAPAQIALVIADNGRGLPEEGREQLVEPYVTTRTKGTGLGLAIVKKIMEDHGGEMQLRDRVPGSRGEGAVVTLLFPPAEAVGDQAEADGEDADRTAETGTRAPERRRGAAAHA